MTATSAAVMGWGYEGKSVEDLLSDAASWAVTTVVDVRLNPLSRKPGFSKRRLAAALAEQDINYVHLPELGNPKDNRAGFAEVGTDVGDAARARFNAEVLDSEGARAALRTVADLAAQGTVLLLCFEASERCCHRALLLSELRRVAELVHA